MPDGKIAICYAENVALNLAQTAYPEGFEHHYVRDEKVLNEPFVIKKPAKIFIDSMSDLFGRWVPDEHIEKVLAVCRKTPWHVFLALTKNPKRMLNFELPKNFWPGVSSPPDFMWKKELKQTQKEKLLENTIKVLASFSKHYAWLSIEPLSWDISGLLARYPGVLKWAVIGAASNGKTYYQPDPMHVRAVLDVLDNQNVPVFFKGNLDWQKLPFTRWRESWPEGQGWRVYDSLIA